MLPKFRAPRLHPCRSGSPARAKEIKNETWSPEIIFIAGDHVPKPEKSRTQNGSAQRPEGIGHTMPAPSKDSGPISAFALNRPIIFQLATKKQKRLVRYETRLGWVWVKPTGTQTIFFLTRRLKIVCYACYPKNCERFGRFENEKSSSPRCAQRP